MCLLPVPASRLIFLNVLPSSLSPPTPFTELQSVLKALAPEVPKLHNLLVEPQRVQPLLTASGVVNHPIGRTRLTALHLLVSLLHTHDEKITQELIELGTLAACVVRRLPMHCHW